MFKRFVGDRAFYSRVFAVMVPILIQNVITNFVSLLDNIMVGLVGTEPMSGVSIVSQLMFVYILAVWGVQSGAGILTAQFYGSEDHRGVADTLKLRLAATTIVMAAAYAVFLGMGDRLINNTIFLKLLENEQMKRKFLERLAYVYHTLTPEVMNAKLTEIKAILEPEMPMHFNRWAKYNDKNINSDSPQTADGAMRYWEERIRRMRDETMVKRPYWIYTLIQKTFALSAEDMVYYFGDEVPQNPEKN